MRPWNKLAINECNEPLVSIPFDIYRMEPHPYLKLGAPYKKGTDPWFLRSEVVNRLRSAQKYLHSQKASFRLALFDAWRPIQVQSFMINYSVRKECLNRGFDPDGVLSFFAKQRVKKEVSMFWAEPSLDPLTPPPHSTGAAIDLTLIDDQDVTLDMGGDIDDIGVKSQPDYYSKRSDVNLESCFSLFADRRALLLKCMESAGFVQHPHEWWHFSYGDQLWAWKRKKSNAIYGSVQQDSKSETNSVPSLST